MQITLKNKMVLVDKKKCIGCGTCAAICEEVFEMKDSEEGMKAFVKDGKGNSNIPCVKEAKDSCPVDAIS